MSRTKNNYAFIDSQNLNLARRDQGWTLNFGRFRKYLADKYAVVKAFLFIGFVPTNVTLYTNLQQQGSILIFKPTLVLSNGRVKGNVDAELVSLLREFIPNDVAFMNNLRGKLEYRKP